MVDSRFFAAPEVDGNSALLPPQRRSQKEMMKILNLTQHVATPEQVADGVIEPSDKSAVSSLLTFDTLPTPEEIQARANALAKIALATAPDDAGTVMIGGAPYLMPPLESALQASGFDVVYSFSKRESIEVPQPDGSVKKSTIFKHAGWVCNHEYTI